MPSRSSSLKLGLTLAVLCCCQDQNTHAADAPANAASPADWQSFHKTVQPFFAKHCYTCHTDKEKGEVRLDRFSDPAKLAKGLATLAKVQRVLAKHAMPPRKRPQPGAEEVKSVLAWLDGFGARMERADSTGRAVVRRLNRAEYNNTVRDLLGVTFQPADDFPADVPGHGFDNVGGVLSVSPALAEKYVAAAEKVARTALFGVEPMQPSRTEHQPYFTADAFSKNRSVKFVYDETGMSLPSALHVTQRFAVTGDYVLRAIMRGWRPTGCDPIELGFWIDGKMIHEAKLAVPTKGTLGRGPGEVNGLWAEYRTRISAGEHWLSITVLRMYEGLPPAYKGPRPSHATSGKGRATDSFFPMYLDVVGPYDQVRGPSAESIAKVFGGIAEPQSLDRESARKILTNLASRAYRRPATAQEVDALLRLVAMVQKDGDSLKEGICLAIQQLLISPHFLFRVEQPPSGTKAQESYRINDYELATRLSYFLWSSMPDEELLACAAKRKLHEPPVLEAQVRRMLKDPKSSALAENFGGQWLQTRALESHTPDRVKFKEFTDYTRMCLKKETDLFFEHVVHEDCSIMDFIDGKYTFLNERLANYYGIPGVKGHEFRKVDLTGTKRAGILTQGSVLTVSSYVGRTSPVLRGKWILDNLLNTPPPPPPMNVPSLSEQGVGQTVSLRAQLEKHRANATCAACHARMDPLGLALENFDAIGQWRDRDGTLPIDTTGTLPDGRSFKGPEELRAILRAEPAAFAECLAEKLLIYALGRGLSRNDQKTAQAIAEKAAKSDYRFSSLILAIMQSEPFQTHKESRATP